MELATLDLFLGVALLLAAALTAGLRRAGRHDLLSWRVSLQRLLGDRAGDLVHIGLYTVAPALLGVAFLALSWLRRGL